jgi:hypothetical protein
VPASDDGARLFKELGRFEQLQAPNGAVLKESSVPVRMDKGLWVNAHLNVPSWGQVFYGRTGLFNPEKLRPQMIVRSVGGTDRVIPGHPYDNSELNALLPRLADSK